MERRTPLKRTAMKRSGSLKPISDKGKARRAEAKAQVAEEGGAFHAAIVGQRCVVCGRTDEQAIEATGYGHQAHHLIRQEVLKRINRLDILWEPALAVCVCEEPCHRRHTNRHSRIPRHLLPIKAVRFARLAGLGLEVLKEYPD